MSGQVMSVPKEKQKLIVYLILAAIAGEFIIPAVYAPLGTYAFTPMTIIATIAGTGLAGLIIAHIKANLLLEAIIGGVTALGTSVVVLLVMGQGATIQAGIGVIFAGNALAVLIVKGLMHKNI